MLQQIFSGSFNFYDVVAYLVAVLLIIFLICRFTSGRTLLLRIYSATKRQKVVAD